MNLKTETLPDGEVGQEYYAEISASIKNSFFDSFYDYNYELEAGDLPEGLFLENDGDVGIISGVPEEAGIFPIGIEVYSNDLAHRAFHDPYINCIDADDTAVFDLLIMEAAEPADAESNSE